MEGMNFILGGYSFQGGGPANSNKDMEMSKREDDFTIHLDFRVFSR
jgi:hypothetical protein